MAGAASMAGARFIPWLVRPVHGLYGLSITISFHHVIIFISSPSSLLGRIVALGRCGLLLQGGVAWSVCQSATIVRPAKMAEPIVIPFRC